MTTRGGKEIEHVKRDNKQNSKKIYLDKYYTPIKLARHCIDKTYEVIGRENISEIIEPSAGSGAFSNQIKDCIAYDIKPEADGIEKSDYLQLNIDYKKDRLIIGNPPFGDRLNLARKFMKKHYQEAEYIAYILPASQYHNNYNFYEFDLAYSEDLGEVEYSGRKVHCCFNIYIRPLGGKLNKRGNLYQLPANSIRIEERVRSTNPARNQTYSGIPDFRICSWGRGSIGRVLSNEEKFAKEIGFYIDDESLREDFEIFISKFNYSDMLASTSGEISPNIGLWRMRQHILEKFLNPRGYDE